MSDCRKCQDPDCTGGYKGGPEQLWLECQHVDSRPLVDKVRWLVAQLDCGSIDCHETIRQYLKRWLDDEKPRYVTDETES